MEEDMLYAAGWAPDIAYKPLSKEAWESRAYKVEGRPPLAFNRQYTLKLEQTTLAKGTLRAPLNVRNRPKGIIRYIFA